MATALLPTTSDGVEDWLRLLANPSDLLKIREAGISEYPYLFGIATVKLAEAHREYLRLLERQAATKKLDDDDPMSAFRKTHQRRKEYR